MKSLIACAALFAALATSTTAEERYDRKLEQAMRDIAAAKMGDLRGSIDYDRRPESIVAQDMVTTGSIRRPVVVREARPARDEMLRVAVERKTARIIAF